MKTTLLAVIIAATNVVSAPQLSTAQLQPASGLDTARGIGERGSIRVQPHSAESWMLRFPKQPNGQPR